MGAVAAFFVFSFPHSCVADQPPVTPDQYNACEDHFNKLTLWVANSPPYDLQEKYTIDLLCEARSADLSRLVEQLDEEGAAFGAPPIDPKSVNTLRAEFVRAVVTSKQFDATGYDRIAISKAVIDGDLNLSGITLNNALQLNDVQFLGNVDFSYSSTEHNLDVSGTLPEAKGLCLKGFHTTASVFINDLHYYHGNQRVKKSTSFCTNTFSDPPSIGLQGARIDGQVSIRSVAVKTIDAEFSQIAGQVLIQNSKISEFVDFSAATVGGLFFLEAKSPNDLNEDIQCHRSAVYLEETDIRGSAEFVRSDLCGISMTGAHVSKNVSLLGSRLAFFDFSGSNAEGDLQIGPSLGPPQRLPVWLPAFGTPKANLVLSHSSVALVRVALNNWPNMCEIGVRSENRKGKCSSPSGLTIDFCTSQQRVPPSALPDSDDHFISIRTMAEWTGFTDLVSWLTHLNSKEEENKSLTVVTDFRFKGFGKPYYCAWDRNALPTDEYRQSDYIFDNLAIDENKLKIWLSSTKYSPAEYQLISDLLVTNGQSSDARKIGYASKVIETRIDLQNHDWFAFYSMMISRMLNGYGYYLELSILWAVLYFLIGALVISSADLHTIRVDEGVIEPVHNLGWRKYVLGPYRFRVIKYTKESPDPGAHKQDYGVINPFAYSFEALLPIIKLRDLPSHYQIELGGWRQYYFYLHRFVGWWFGIFLVAALSGLAK